MAVWQQQALQRLRLESFFSQHFGCCRRWRAEQRFNLCLFAGGNQFAQRSGFAAAGQPTQASNAVTGAQDMINRPALIFAQPVGRPITGMQWRDGIASRVDRLNQVQFRRQNLRRGKSTLGFDQVRRTLHGRFQRRQIHFARRCDRATFNSSCSGTTDLRSKTWAMA